MKVAVLGGGVSGLVAAYRLLRAGHDVVCYEASPRPGGLVRSERRDGFLCESGAHGMLDGAPEVRALIDELGLSSRLVTATPTARRRLVFAGGRLREIPTGPRTLITTNLLSPLAKLRLVREPFVRKREPRGTDDDESVFDFAVRRLGPDAARRLMAPAAMGVFAGDAARLSLASAFPRLAAWESDHGSLFRGLRHARRSGTGPGRLVSFADGVDELPRALASRLGHRLVIGRVSILRREAAGFRLALAGGAGEARAEAVLLALPPRDTAALLAGLAPEAAALLHEIQLASVAVVCLGFRSRAIGLDLGAYGFLAARGEGCALLGCLYESSVFPGRAPEGQVLLRVMYGGTFDPAAVEQSDGALVERSLAELRAVAGLDATPDVVALFRHREALPQYELGHQRRVRAIEQALVRVPGLHVIGVALRGVGLADCVRSAAAAARALR